MRTSFLTKKIISFLAFSLIIFSLFENCSQNSSEKKSNEPAQDKDTHLGEMMGQMQYYFVKLGLALQHRNQRLASFYLNEVNEVSDDIASKDITSDGRNISLLITQILQSKKSDLKTVIAANDTSQFDVAYHALLTSCNNCHIETNHDFIIIEEPHGNFNGQNFAVQRSLFSE